MLIAEATAVLFKLILDFESLFKQSPQLPVPSGPFLYLSDPLPQAVGGTLDPSHGRQVHPGNLFGHLLMP